jgi:hypothetical protein
MHCPVAAQAAWLAVTGITEGFIFRGDDRHDNISDRALTQQSVRRVFKKSVECVGGDKNAVNPRTLRAGYITQAVMARHPIWKIKRV